MAYGQTGSGKSFTMQEDPDHIGSLIKYLKYFVNSDLLFIVNRPHAGIRFSKKF